MRWLGRSLTRRPSTRGARLADKTGKVCQEGQAMRCLLLVLIAVACGCKSSNFWRPKPDNFARRESDRSQKLWAEGNSDTGNLRVGNWNVGSGNNLAGPPP